MMLVTIERGAWSAECGIETRSRRHGCHSAPRAPHSPLLALALVILGALTGCQQAAPDTSPKVAPPVPVTVAPVSEKTVRRTIPVTGTLYGFEDITLSPKVDGQVAAVLADVGDIVKPGDELLRLDVTDYDLTVRVETSGVLEREAQVASARTLVDQAKATQENAEQDMERFKSTGSQSEKDAARSRAKVAKANVQAAEAGVESAAAALEVKKRSLAIAQQRLRDATLRVPELPADSPGKAYRVADRMVSRGEMTRSFPGTNAFRLVISDTLKLKVTVPEKHAPDVKVGQVVDVRVDSFGGTTFPGTVARISPTVDPQTRTFHVEVAVPNADGRLKAGGFVRAEVVVGTAPAVVIPPAALVVFAGVSKVFVADGDKAVAVPVQVGDRGPDWLEVSGDLKPGQRVVTSGFIQLFDGAAVAPRR
jgi:RND family efflux transporter MFP subunit